MSNPFWDYGFAIAPGLLTAADLAFLRDGIALAERHGALHSSSKPSHRGSGNQYKPVPGELVLRAVQPRLEAIVARPLLPTYSYWRIYQTGMALERHRDRHACEVSVSLTIAAEPADSDWPLRLTDLAGRDQAPSLAPGDGLLYQGCAVPHWREPLAGVRHCQIFLHYVLADGEHAALAGDPQANWAH